jgi:nucleoside-diphosphate-sugar epimerase
VTDEATTVLVTGAMGQVGSRLTELLLERGRRVVALDLATEKTTARAAALRPAPGRPGELVATFVDLTDADAVRAVVERERPDAVVHLAAVVSPPCYRSPELARRVNVDGTANLVAAAGAQPSPPVFVQASSTAVYGSRNPYRKLGRLTPETAVGPIECYGAHKVAAERIVTGSGLRAAVLRIGGILSPDGLALSGPDYFVLMRATPRDNRVHMVDARDVALAFANALDRIDAVDGKVVLVGGDESYVHTHAGVQDDVFAAIGLGRVGPSTNLPGDPDDDRGWGLTDWLDTTESQELLDFQQHRWDDTLDWLAQAQGRRRIAARAVGPLARPALRTVLAVHRRLERRGPYADPWSLIARTYGEHVLVDAADEGGGAA